MMARREQTSTRHSECYRHWIASVSFVASLLLVGVVVGQEPITQPQASTLRSVPSEIAPPQQLPAKLNMQLRTLNAHALHTRMQKVLRRQLPTSQDPSGTWLGFNIDQVAGPPVTIWANTREPAAQLSGPQRLVTAWEKVISTLDSPRVGSSVTQVVSTKPGSQAKVTKAVSAMTVAAQTAQPPANSPAPNGPPSRLGVAEAPAEDDSVGVSLLGPVQIESVEGTDILLLRGNPRDVQRVLEVIEQIESMSEVGDPEIEIVELQHVESDALATLLKQIFSESLNSEKYGYGSVGIYPLSRPNSILLIALPTTMQRAKETLAKLDRPGKEATQFETFSLKHATADTARSIVENLFSAEQTDAEGTASLAPKAEVIADTRTNSLIVRASPRDLDEVRELVQKIDQIGSQSANELRVVRLQNTVAENLEDVLQDAFTGDPDDDDDKLSQLLRLVTIDAEGRQKLESGVLADAKVIATEGANALVVTAPSESMPLLLSLIKQLDQAPNAAIELKIFPLENGDATALVETLSELFSTGEGDDNEGDITRLRVEVDERTNSILAAGTLDDLVTVEAILRTLDSAEGRDRENRVYRLRHKFAEDLAQALNQLLQAERDVQNTAPGTVSPFEQLEREVLVVPEVSGNSLLVSASPSYFEKMDRLISELDVRDDMVMIQVLIAEIELGDVDEFGVELGLQDPVLFDRSLLGDLLTTQNTTITNDAGGGSTTFTEEVVQSATNTPGFNFGDPSLGLGNAGSDASLASAGTVAAQGISNFAVNRVSPDAGFGGLVLSASSNSVSMLLRALQESRRLEVLSRPQIMALNNQEGSAFVGQLVPFIVRSDLNQLGLTTNTVEQVEVGLSLVVYPRISPDGLVVMDITATNNRLRPLNEGVPVAVSPNGDPILQPIQDAIQARTVVSAMSGQTVVLSGLITKEDNALHRRVPILADIPLLGDLFRFDSVSTTRRELLIVMTPHVVKSRFESEMLKQVESARMNWCLTDVVNLHGPAGLRSQTDREGAAESETIYPEQLPPGAVMPPEAAMPGEIMPGEIVVPQPIPVPQ
ncbi:MAG: secretin N-terminal domain-containing protein [Planctomycetota bacterium]